MRFLFVVTLALAPLAVATDARGQTNPLLLSFDELAALSSTPNPQGVLADRVARLLTTPFVENAGGSIRPHRPLVNGLGPVLRVAYWNIERGRSFDAIRQAFTGPATFTTLTASAAQPSRNGLYSELDVLKNSDIVVLNEVDLGMKRTGYRDVARDLARALGMHYAYAVEFIEVDRLLDLGLESVALQDGDVQRAVNAALAVDRGRFRGLHGNAILSRYPIRRARIVRLPAGYDWYGEEMRAISRLEAQKRWTAATLFKERVTREVRHGGRMALVADLEIPEAPTGCVTVVSVHLENRCAPACRRRQMEALLAELRDVPHPVVVAGDLNTSGTDATPTSVRREVVRRLGNHRFWTDQAVRYINPVSIPQLLLAPARWFHRHLDPTTRHVPLVWRNEARGLFSRIEKFRFADGGAFDFRGDALRTVRGKAGTLANSNQRGKKGFEPTFSFERTYGGVLGHMKLDWMLVKPFIQHPRDTSQSYRLAPHFPRTMRALNEFIDGRISDHAPLTVDLPLLEPERLPQ